MATDATGTPTSLGIPTFNTAVDAPSGAGSNAQMTAIDAILKPSGIATGEALVWSGTAWVRSTSTKLGVSSITAGSDTQVLTTSGSTVTWAAPASSGVPTGAMTQWSVTTAPSGWVLCDGTSYLRSGGGVDALFAVIGVTYGNADGTHFNVPDLRGRIPVGLGTNGSVNGLNQNDGQAVGNRRPQHRTSITDPGHVHTMVGGVGNAGGGLTDTNQSVNNQNQNTTSNGTGITVGTGNANDALDVPSFIVVNYIIKT